MSISVVEKYDGEKWHAVAAEVKLETRLFIDGEYVDAIEGGKFDTINPATGEVITAMAEGTSADVDRAVASSLRAFRSGSWARMAPRERMEVLYRLAELIDEHSEELSVLETLDMGKPITDVTTLDMPGVIETFQYFAECIDKVESAVTATEHEVLHYTLRQPLGVIGAISPWNYPLLMATWKVAPALAAGSSQISSRQ